MYFLKHLMQQIKQLLSIKALEQQQQLRTKIMRKEASIQSVFLCGILRAQLYP
jgi:hypothetical protein